MTQKLAPEDKNLLTLSEWLDALGIDSAYRKDMKESYQKDIPALNAQLTKARPDREYIKDKMHSYDFSSVVYFHPGKEYKDWGGRWVVGVQTGIDNDLICVKKCRTREEEKKWLSPEGDDVVDALDKAIALFDKEIE